MTLLALKKLECGRLAHVVYVFFICKAVQTDALDVCHAVFFHNLINAVENKVRHTVICFIDSLITFVSDG